MDVVVGKYSGFCAGVNYTYIKAKEEIQKGKTYCLGEIIHNKQVINELEDMGMITVDKIEEIPNGSRVIFRAHGEPLEVYKKAEDKNLEVIDLTCGRVKIIHNKVSKEKENSFILIIGKKTHPEIIGTLGFSGESSYVIESFDDIEPSFEKYLSSGLNKVYVVSQTTFSSELFDLIVEKIKDTYKDSDIVIDKTICDATSKRQKETEELSNQSDMVLVIGSSNSSNTKELYNIAINNCKEVYFIENLDDLKDIKFNNNYRVGVVAGASAPKYLIESVVDSIKAENL